MNSRQRFLATMNFEPVDRPPLWEFGYWADTLRRWYREGLPRRVGFVDSPDLATVYGEGMVWDAEVGPLDRDVHFQFGLDEGIRRVPLNSFIYPPFEPRILEDDGENVTAVDPRGHIARYRKGRDSIVHIVKTLVETRDDWERVKSERLQPKLEGRLPPDWPEQREQLKQRDFPLCVGGFAGMAGFFHSSRYLMGPEHLLCSFHEQPDLVKDIMNHLAEFQTSLLDQVLSQIDVDFAYWTEDIGYNAGPFIGPKMFREFMLPCYKKITGMLHDHGVKIILLDTDGNNWKLIPEFIRAGVTGIGPMEVAASMDVLRLRQDYPHFAMLGGIDKRAVAQGKEGIELELAKVHQVLPKGGYIPHIDHAVPPDVSWENFAYYRRRLAELVEAV